jgi:cation:H+ antiporter
VTSLPEVVVSWMALKQLNAVNLALGNIMGSCLFNMGIIFVFDLASLSGPVFIQAGQSHLISVYGGIIMIALVSYAIHIRKKRRANVFFSCEMISLALVYLGTLYLIFLTS